MTCWPGVSRRRQARCSGARPPSPIKAAAQRRNWRHNTHALLRNAVDRLVYERRALPHLLGQYAMASEFHAGFYGDRMFTAVQIRYGRDPIAEFVGTLENLG